MNEEQIIERLRALKNLEPTDTTISALKRKVFLSMRNADLSGTDAGPIPSTRLSRALAFPPLFAYGGVALIAIALFATQGGYAFDAAHTAYDEMRIAITSNGYDKARFSLDLAKGALAELQRGKADPAEIAYISDTSSQTDSFMNALNLTGIPGKYSTEQCLSAYQVYKAYLEDLQAAVNRAAATADPSVGASLLGLKDKAGRYEQAADARLKLY